ncbi:flavocytochrome c [Paraeggerthella hongkongensis]|uniref:flavocytochrome c n=1 Tax=Paraeggerthella TaxID=651554 RepID=UPI000DF79C54|nr:MULTISPECIES: flavocytochrome c [Paraeggerthella]MBU5404766.1 flavocytochrome c [Paraeggerthella hongkongensis]MCD2433246.1 flavocytochrome c [Paraeggerthella hominis]RDB59276.1 flavocytochrome c [Paraeggerthella hongkongensis]
MAGLSRRQFLTGAALATAGGALTLGGCTSSGSAAKERSADASIATVGSGMGKHGAIQIEVVSKDGAIERIDVLDSRESAGLGDVCMKKLGKLIVDNQTLNVDVVTGASLSSMAYLTAVAEALDKAGEKSSEWKKRDRAVQQPESDIPTAFDIVVVGTGGAGFTAAISAANKGQKVLLMEKLGVFGGSTALSGGEMAVPGNWIQQNSGLSDSSEQLANDMLEGGDHRGDPALVNVIANGVYDAAQWLTYEGGISWEHNLLFFGGHSVKRSIIPSGHIGNAMTTKLTARAQSIDNITLIDNTKATALVQDANGGIGGIKATNTVTGNEYSFECKAVVLACGGFGANVEMREQANPEFGKQFNSTDSVGAQGDGLTMASAIGAELVDMELIQTYPICDVNTGALLYLDDMRLDERTVMFNKEGKRFVEELGRRDVLSKAILKQTDERAYEIWDQAAADETKVVDIHADEFENLVSRNLCTKADTLEEACEPFGIDAAALAKTIEQWNSYVDAGSDPDFAYRGTMHKIDTPPYYIMAYKPAVHYTMGGLHINANAEVLDANGNPIPGLFAAGEVAGHKMGANRLGSTSMADIYTFGRVAGNNAADYVG